MFHKSTLVKGATLALAVATFSTTMIAQSGDAEARGGRKARGIVGAIVGGAAAAAIIGSAVGARANPYYGQPQYYQQPQPQYYYSEPQPQVQYYYQQPQPQQYYYQQPQEQYVPAYYQPRPRCVYKKKRVWVDPYTYRWQRVRVCR